MCTIISSFLWAQVCTPIYTCTHTLHVLGVYYVDSARYPTCLRAWVPNYTCVRGEGMHLPMSYVSMLDMRRWACVQTRIYVFSGRMYV